MNKTAFQGLRISALASLIAWYSLTLADATVTEIMLETTHQLNNPVEVRVSASGDRYTHIANSPLKIAVRYKAACKGEYRLATIRLGVGRLNLHAGHMSDKQKYHFQDIPISTGSKSIDWQSHQFNVPTGQGHEIVNIDPVKACNDFLEKKTRENISRADFMSKERKIGLEFSIAAAAECRRKWKAEGFWNQSLAPVNALIVCQPGGR